MKFIFLFLICFQIFSCEQKKTDNKKNILLAVVAYRLSYGVTSGKYDCVGIEASKSFKSLFTAFENAKNPCTNCHNSDSKTANLDLSIYSQATSKTLILNPEGSLLFQKVTDGTMKFYSDEKTNQSIYCWILNGNRG